MGGGLSSPRPIRSPPWNEVSGQKFARGLRARGGTGCLLRGCLAPPTKAGKARPLFSGPFLGGIGGVTVPGLSFPDYDVSADGQRFVMFSGEANDLGSSTVNIVTGWFTELRRLTNSEDE